MAAEHKSLNTLVENGMDTQLSEDILSELSNTRRSVRQQAIKLQKEELVQDQPEDGSKSLSPDLVPADKESIDQDEVKESTSLREENALNDFALISEEKDVDTSITPQKRGRGRPRKRKYGGRSVDGSAEKLDKQRSTSRTDSEAEETTPIQTNKSQENIVAAKDNNISESVKDSGHRVTRKSIPERSVRMSPLKNIPAAQREAVSAKVSGAKQKLELGNKLSSEKEDSKFSAKVGKEDKHEKNDNSDKNVKNESKRKRKREEELLDAEKMDDEMKKRETRRHKQSIDAEEKYDEFEKRETRRQRQSLVPEEKDEEMENQEIRRCGEQDEHQNENIDLEKDERLDEPKKKRGRPRKHPIQTNTLEMDKKVTQDSKTTNVESESAVNSKEEKTCYDNKIELEICADTNKTHEGTKCPNLEPLNNKGDVCEQVIKTNQDSCESVNQDVICSTQAATQVVKTVIEPKTVIESVSTCDANTKDVPDVSSMQTTDNPIWTEDKELNLDDVEMSVPSASIEYTGAGKETFASLNISNVDYTHDSEPPDISSETNVSEPTLVETLPVVPSDISHSIINTVASVNVESTVINDTTTAGIKENAEDNDHLEPMDVISEVTVAAPIPILGADAAANALPSNSPSADFPVGTAGSVTPQKNAAQDTKKVTRKPKPKPRGYSRTHFGQQKKTRRPIKRNNYDSDSTDVQSECSTEGQPTGKKYKRSNSTSTHASLESEDDRSSHSSVNKGITNIPALPDAITSQAEPPLCSCKMEWDKPPSSNVTTCNAHEVINSKLVECGMSVDGLKVLRPSTRVGFKTLCEEHRRKMAKHQCCPGCGCFCSAGIMMMCTVEKVNHHFHKECIKEIDGTLYCPHCGENASLAKEVTLPSTEALEQLKCVAKSVLLNGNLTLPRVLLARLTGMSSKALAVHMGEEEDLQTPKARMQAPISRKGVAPLLPMDDVQDDLPSKSITLKSGITISSAALPPGPSRDALETALQFLDTESPKKLRFFPKNLYLSTSQGDLDKVLQMLGDGFDPNYRFPSHNHETALHVAAAKGHLEIISMLLQAGANIDPTDEDHRTPLHVATENGQVLCMKYLVKHGANPQHLDDDGMSILHAAAKIGSLEAIQFILSLRKVSINVQDDGGWSPIIWAAESKNVPVVTYLIERGADPNSRDKEGNTALHWASFAGADSLSELFLNRGCDVQAVNVHGDSPLHIAARESFTAVVNMLLMREADISIRNKEGETPIDCTTPKSDINLALLVNKRMKYTVAKRAIKTEKIISRDISRGMEAHPIPVVNAVDEESVPDDFLYVSESCETSRLNIDRNIKHMQGCLCVDDCALETCTCARSSVQCWYSSEGHLLPEFNFHEPPMIFECGRACFCWRNCRNRVVQNGIKTHLVLFRTPKMGWGIRTTQDIKQGTFICEYAGELISDADADQREDDSYLFDLDNREGDVYCIDARFYGNISRFVNHLCEPNIVPVRVFIDHHDLRFPRIAFFTSRDVRANEELGFDYGDKFWAIKAKFFTCCCGSRLCKHSQPAPDLFNETNNAGVEI